MFRCEQGTMRTSPLAASWRKESEGTPATSVLSQMTSRTVLARIAESSESQYLSSRLTFVCVKKYLHRVQVQIRNKSPIKS